MDINTLPPDTVHVKDGFYRNDSLGVFLLNERGEILGDDNVITKGNCESDYYSYKSIHVHRLMLLMFKIPPDDISKLQGNHIDGNKLNNDINNLEWCTPSENIIHAYENGLRTDNIPILIKDLSTEEIHRFATMNLAARALGVDGSYLHNYLSNRDRVKGPYRFKWSIIKEGEEWPIIDNKMVSGYSKAILAISVTGDGANYIFNSLQDSSYYLGINSGTIGWYLNRRGVSGDNLYKGYRWYFLHEYEGDISEDWRVEVTRKKKERKPRRVRQPLRVAVTNIATGDVVIWNSIEEYAKSIGMKKNSLQKAIYLKDGVYRGKKFVYIK